LGIRRLRTRAQRAAQKQEGNVQDQRPLTNT
jgi:hypothetical protein